MLHVGRMVRVSLPDLQSHSFMVCTFLRPNEAAGLLIAKVYDEKTSLSTEIKNMRSMLFIAAATGFVVSVIVHLASFTEFPVLKVFPAVFSLHIGIFVIAVVGALTLKEFSTLLANIPQNVVCPLSCLFAYAVINFFVTLNANQMGVPDICGGQPVLEAHGQVITTLSGPEYDRHQNILVRGFSGHWMLFYFALSAGLLPLSVRRVPKPTNERLVGQRLGGS